MTLVGRVDSARLLGALLGLVGFGFSAYLTYVELAVIDAVCQWCVASAVTMTLLGAVLVARALRPTPPSRSR